MGHLIKKSSVIKHQYIYMEHTQIKSSESIKTENIDSRKNNSIEKKSYSINY